MAKPNEPNSERKSTVDLNAKVEHTELQARLLEAQVRVIEARKKLAALRKAAKDAAKAM